MHGCGILVPSVGCNCSSLISDSGCVWTCLLRSYGPQRDFQFACHIAADPSRPLDVPACPPTASAELYQYQTTKTSLQIDGPRKCRKLSSTPNSMVDCLSVGFLESLQRYPRTHKTMYCRYRPMLSEKHKPLRCHRSRMCMVVISTSRAADDRIVLGCAYLSQQ